MLPKNLWIKLRVTLKKTICKPRHWNLGTGIGIGTDITNVIISSSIRPMDPKITGWWIRIRGRHPQSDVTLWSRGYVSNKESYISTSLDLWTPNLAEDEGTPVTSDVYIKHVVTWQIKDVILPLSQGLWILNLAGWWQTMKGPHPQNHVTHWSSGHVTNQKRCIYTFTRPMDNNLAIWWLKMRELHLHVTWHIDHVATW